MKTGVTGATGQLGRLVIAALLQKNLAPSDIVAIVRNPEKAADLAKQGITIRQGDYNKPETLEKALVGLDQLLLISANEVGKRLPQHRHVIEAAKKNQIKHLVYTSLLHADTSAINLAEEHRQTEALIRESGIPFTFLRNGWYHENYVQAIVNAVLQGMLAGCAGNGKIASAARADYAEAAAVVLTTSGHENKIYELAGDEAWTMDDLAKEITRQTGKQIVYRNMSEQEYASLLAGSGLPAEIAQMIAGWDAAIAHGHLFDDSHQLGKLIGRPTTPIADTVKKALESIK
ncbi:MAG: SDR family oxidoreductase [Thermoflavifilum aggregans]|nr:SDR family oxidoreductase [Thermoflavifilum aggregans]